MWFYVFNTNGVITVGTELRGRECAYQHHDQVECVRFAKALATSAGSLAPCRNAFPSVNARGKAISASNDHPENAPSIDIRSLVIRNTNHVPQRRVV